MCVSVFSSVWAQYILSLFSSFPFFHLARSYAKWGLLVVPAFMELLGVMMSVKCKACQLQIVLYLCYMIILGIYFY